MQEKGHKKQELRRYYQVCGNRFGAKLCQILKRCFIYVLLDFSKWRKAYTPKLSQIKLSYSLFLKYRVIVVCIGYTFYPKLQKNIRKSLMNTGFTCSLWMTPKGSKWKSECVWKRVDRHGWILIPQLCVVHQHWIKNLTTKLPWMR